MTYRNYGNQLGGIPAGNGYSISAGAVEFVMNGITYRADSNGIYRRQNGQLILVTNQQELNSVEAYYANNVAKPSQAYSNPTYPNTPSAEQLAALQNDPFASNSNSSANSAVVLAAVGVGLLLLLSRR